MNKQSVWRTNLQLALLQIRMSVVVQWATAILVASAITALSFLGASTSASTGNAVKLPAASRDRGSGLDGYFHVRLVEAQINSAPSMIQSPIELVAGWRKDSARTNLGTLPVLFLDFTLGASGLLSPGVAMVPPTVAKRLGLSTGDQLMLNGPGEVITLTVSDALQTTVFAELDMGERIIIYTGETQKNEELLYRRRSGFTGPETVLMQELSAEHPNAKIRPAYLPYPYIAILPSNAPLEQMKGTLVLFIFLAFLTARLLAFLENQRVLAILKSFGLKATEVMGFIASEAMLAPLGGVFLGIISSVTLLLALDAKGYDIILSYRVVLGALLPVVFALGPGILVPSRLAGKGTVNQLMFERPIHLFHERVSSLRRKNSGLDQFVKRGVKFVRLDMHEGYFEGIILRKIGDTVRAGEPLAVLQTWWGLKITEYVSPQNGVIVYYQEDTGYFGVAPSGEAILS